MDEFSDFTDSIRREWGGEGENDFETDMSPPVLMRQRCVEDEFGMNLEGDERPHRLPSLIPHQCIGVLNEILGKYALMPFSLRKYAILGVIHNLSEYGDKYSKITTVLSDLIRSYSSEGDTKGEYSEIFERVILEEVIRLLRQ